MTAAYIAWLGAAAAVSWALTGAVRRYALARSMIDVPGHRSSHERPTPRGGGLAIAIVALAGTGAAGAAGLLEPRVAAGIVGGGAMIATVGWVDDRGGLPARVRALVHLIAAVWLVAWIGGTPVFVLTPLRLELGLAGSALSVLMVVWFVNLYNFMDGIDGLAAGEAVAVGLGGGALLLAVGRPGLAFVAFLVAAASGGFLAWNWAPARIFMGDIGSGLLGFLFAAIALASEAAAAVPLTVWVVLLAVFVFDATVTLLRRVARGERWYDAHRSHAYQRAAQAAGSHARVSGVVAALNVALGVMALAAVRYPSLQIPALAAAALLLLGVYLRVEAVRPMRPSAATSAASGTGL